MPIQLKPTRVDAIAKCSCNTLGSEFFEEAIQVEYDVIGNDIALNPVRIAFVPLAACGVRIKVMLLEVEDIRRIENGRQSFHLS